MDFTTLIANNLFPIAACGAMAWYVQDVTKQFMTRLSETEKQHADEIDTLKECINNNTLVQEKILEHIRKE